MKKRLVKLTKFIAIFDLFLCAACASRETPPLNQASAISPVLPDRVELYYFYEELCGSCEGDAAEFNIIARERLAPVQDRYPYALHTVNIYRQENRPLYLRILTELGLDRNPPEPPFLIAGGRVFQGHGAIARDIQEAYLTAGEDLFVNRRVYKPLERKTGPALFEDYPLKAGGRTLVYFYRVTCDGCNAVKPLIDGLPPTAQGPGGPVPLDILRFNTRSGNNGERIAAFFDIYQVPNEDRMVPILFLEEGYLAGYDAISTGLLSRLSQPPGVNRMANLLPSTP